MIKLVDLTYYTETEDSLPQQLLERHKAALGFVDHIKDLLQITVIKHMDFEGTAIINDVPYAFFKSKNRFKHVPSKTHRYIKKLQPDIVLVQGLIFPFQLLALRIYLGRKTKIIAQHHGGNPAKGLIKFFQKMADKCIDAYLFTAAENADNWLKEDIISNKNKCFELLEASTWFTKQDPAESNTHTGIQGDENFVWVGRLNANKDPLTVLRAFAEYAAININARLYMIYQTEELLAEVKTMISQNESLKKAVILKGPVAHEELAYWFSAANFYISASHSEGSGYALIEAMACGCIPVVTNIPSYKKITADGQYGFLFEKGNSKNLFEILCRTKGYPQQQLSRAVIKHFNTSLSFQSIAENLHTVCIKLTAE